MSLLNRYKRVIKLTVQALPRAETLYAEPTWNEVFKAGRRRRAQQAEAVPQIPVAEPAATEKYSPTSRDYARGYAWDVGETVLSWIADKLNYFKGFSARGYTPVEVAEVEPEQLGGNMAWREGDKIYVSNSLSRPEKEYAILHETCVEGKSPQTEEEHGMFEAELLVPEVFRKAYKTIFGSAKNWAGAHRTALEKHVERFVNRYRTSFTEWTLKHSPHLREAFETAGNTYKTLEVR